MFLFLFIFQAGFIFFVINKHLNKYFDFNIEICLFYLKKGLVFSLQVLGFCFHGKENLLWTDLNWGFRNLRSNFRRSSKKKFYFHWTFLIWRLYFHFVFSVFVKVDHKIQGRDSPFYNLFTLNINLFLNLFSWDPKFP